MKVSNWGNYPAIEAEVASFTKPEEAREQLSKWQEWIPRGMGRCYGDSSLAPQIISTLKYNRMLAFDENTGWLSCQCGVTFHDILEVFLPRGWFPPVTPGTKFVSIGGAIASDVHGKNHHSEGSFSAHLGSFLLMKSSGEVVHCSREENADLFAATCGGMGLTGLVLEATFKLKKVETAFIAQRSQRAGNLEEAMKLFEAGMHYTYSMAWIDCFSKGTRMGRSVLLMGEHAKAGELMNAQQKAKPLEIPAKRKLSVPFNFPGFALNKVSLKLFNYFYYHKAPARQKDSIVTYDQFFYPLDGILNWNRIYGKRGFTQYQCVLPPHTSYEGLKKILEKINKQGSGSFLAVLKWFGKQDSLLSFPMEGYTLALDFPISAKLFPFLDELDKIVQDCGGRLYLTKDARMSREMFAKTYPHLSEFETLKRSADPEDRIKSLQWKRLH
jgi:decaprenylphospho-beta-D-ribofuranose 2-oxidase